ncbi:MAG: leucyl/phenylalanyl-tRNA--protein transferase [Woeseiaceae bacterium]|nr:leucyl/phenylalanyl-tRNA--protein transferase [Woeseiaceae bacterium]
MTTNRVAWLTPDDPPSAFPSIYAALTEPDGLLAAGGDLSRDRLLYAYRHGIFPWYDDGQPILWWSPDPRCVLPVGAFHVSKRLRRDISKSTATLTFNRDFAAVIDACAEPRRSQQGTWITDEMADAYVAIHRDGWAHSVEVWQGERLIGGMYGLAIGRVFFGESMFSREDNASKFALLGLCRVLDLRGFELVDCQLVSEHLLTLGATAMPRAEFAELLRVHCDPAVPIESWPADPISVSELNSAGPVASLQ